MYKPLSFIPVAIMDEYESDIEFENEVYEDCEDFNEEYEQPSIWDWKSIFALAFIIFGMIGLSVLVLHRDSRPRALYTLFGVFDKQLKGPQQWVDGVVEKGAKLGNDLSSWKWKKSKPSQEEIMRLRKDEQYHIDLIEIKLRSKNNLWNDQDKHNVEEPVDDVIQFWIGMKERVVEDIRQLRESKRELEAELTAKKAERRALYNETDGGSGTIKDLNDTVKAQVEVIKQLNFSQDLIDFDAQFAETYVNLFNSALLDALIEDAEARQANLASAIEHIQGNPYIDKMFYNKSLIKYKKKSGKLDKLKDFFTSNHLTNVKEKWESADSEKFAGFQFYKEQLRRIKDSDFIQRFAAENEYQVLREYQQLERKLFEISAQDLNYHDKIFSTFKLVDFSERFMSEFKDDLEAGRLQKYNKNQQIRISNLKKMTNSKENEEILALWHKRNLLDLFTSPQLVRFDNIQALHVKLVHGLTLKTKKWIEKMLMVKEGDYRRILPIFYERLAEEDQDHDKKIFKLDRVLSDFKKYFDNRAVPIAISQSSFDKIYNGTRYAILPDGMMFSAALIFGKIAKMSPEEQTRIKEEWPKTAEDDESLLMNFSTSMAKKIGYIFWDHVAANLKDQCKVLVKIDECTTFDHPDADYGDSQFAN